LGLPAVGVAAVAAAESCCVLRRDTGPERAASASVSPSPSGTVATAPAEAEAEAEAEAGFAEGRMERRLPRALDATRVSLAGAGAASAAEEGVVASGADVEVGDDADADDEDAGVATLRPDLSRTSCRASIQANMPMAESASRSSWSLAERTEKQRSEGAREAVASRLVCLPTYTSDTSPSSRYESRTGTRRPAEHQHSRPRVVGRTRPTAVLVFDARMGSGAVAGVLAAMVSSSSGGM
jgi:hypothetical protein